MDKIALKLQKKQFETLIYDKNAIEVKTFLSQAEMEVLLESYLKEIVSSSMLNVIRAEMFLMLEIVGFCTNIDMGAQVSDESGEMSFLIDKNTLFEHYDLYKEIISKIKNYDYFRKMLDFSVNELIEQRRLEFSIGKVFSDFAKKVNGILDTISDGAISEENIEKVKELISQVTATTEKMNAEKEIPTPAPKEKKPSTRKRK